MCKICWCDHEEEDNPKVQACHCDGSMKYVHFLCLKKWLESRMTIKDSNNHHTLQWKQFGCEICLYHYSYCFEHQGKIWSLVDFKRPTDPNVPYIILESQDIEKNASRIIHTAIFNDPSKKFSLGRGHESDLRINDISVSRLHASLQYKNDSFLLIDCRSKFGTLALHHGDLNLDIGVSKTLQIGRTVITVVLKA